MLSITYFNSILLIIRVLPFSKIILKLSPDQVIPFSIRRYTYGQEHKPTHEHQCSDGDSSDVTIKINNKKAELSSLHLKILTDLNNSVSQSRTEKLPAEVRLQHYRVIIAYQAREHEYLNKRKVATKLAINQWIHVMHVRDILFERFMQKICIEMFYSQIHITIKYLV